MATKIIKKFYENDRIIITNDDFGGDSNNLGYFVDITALETAYPTANDGNYAILGSTDTIWIWDTDTATWVDSGNISTGDVTGPSTNNDSYIPQWDGVDSKTLKNGIPVSTFEPAKGVNDNYVTDAEKIVIGNTSGTNSGDNATNTQYSGLATSKQDTLVNQTNIKSINGQSLLGAGDIEITSGGGGGFTPVYLTDLTSTTNPAYKQSSYTPDVAETIVNTITNNNEVLARTYIFDGDVGLTTINAGTWNFDVYAYVSSAVGITKIRLETFKRTAGGTETTLFSATSDEINATTKTLFSFNTTQPVFTCNATDRLGTRIYVNTTAVINITASYVVGDGTASFFTTPLQLRASQVRNTPAGNISSTDVQGAINELDTEKAKLAGDITQSFGASTIELGHRTDTTLSRVSAGVIAVEGITIPSVSSTNTLTNKRVTKRVVTTTQRAEPAINTDNGDIFNITGLAQAITSFTTNLTGTPVDGDMIIVNITDNGTARALSWGTSFEASKIALPTTTVISTLLKVGFQYNGVTSKWRCIAVA